MNADARSRKSPLALAAVLAFTLALAPLPSPGAEPEVGGKKLNVLFIVVDDLGCRLGCYGDPDVKSPNVDRLAARGVRFDRAYCQYPVCNASRSSFLSGLRPDTTDIFSNDLPFRDKLPDAVTLPELFRRSGYFTAGLGKIFHLGRDASGKPAFHLEPKSWDDCRDFAATAAGLRGPGRNLTGGKIPAIRWLAAEGSDDDQPDGQLAAEAIRLLEAHRDGPFFLGVGFHKPHDPFNAPKAYFDLYPPDQVRLLSGPESRAPENSLSIPRNSPLASLGDAEQRELKRAYMAGLSFMDAQLGKVLEALERLKLWESTIIVFMGDHGYHLGEHGWWNKVTVYELCARPPLIVWTPGAKGMGKTARGLVEFIDVYPTLADLCGLNPPAGLEGTSFRPLLDDPSRPGKPAAFTQVIRGQASGRSVRTDRWRYTEWDGGKKGAELYDHNNDPGELHNVAADPTYAGDLVELKALLRAGHPPTNPRR
jgi:arylsulfatase A-like enzyme